MSGAGKSVSPRQLAWSVALAVTVAATLWAAQMEEGDVGVTPAPAKARPARQPSAPAPLPPTLPTNWAPVERAPWPAPPQAQLAAWAPPAPPPAPPAPPSLGVRDEPQAPVAPSFPYQLIGRLEEGGVSRALLSGGSRSLSAKAGDVIDGQWRVEQVGPSGLSLIWLPGQQPQTINFRPS